MSAVSWPHRLSPMTPEVRYTGCVTDDRQAAAKESVINRVSRCAAV